MDLKYENDNETSKPKNLHEAIRKARLKQADRNDAVADSLETKKARLEILAENLIPIFNDLPEDNEQFECLLTMAGRPRLWIDMMSYITMAKNSRTYQFVKLTRFGRKTLTEHDEINDMCDSVIEYIANQFIIIEKLRNMEDQYVELAQLNHSLTYENIKNSEDTKNDGLKNNTNLQDENKLVNTETTHKATKPLEKEAANIEVSNSDNQLSLNEENSESNKKDKPKILKRFSKRNQIVYYENSNLKSLSLLAFIMGCILGVGGSYLTYLYLTGAMPEAILNIFM